MKEVCLYMKFGFWLILTTYKVQPIQTGLSNIITRALLDSIFRYISQRWLALFSQQIPLLVEWSTEHDS